jgi:hypothetical protein
MFDLEYYNEITDYGKLVEEILKAQRKTIVYIKQKDKKQLMENIDYNNNRLIIMNIFNRKHTYAYNNWYDNYYNKLSIKSHNYTYNDEWHNNITNRLNKLH